VVQAERPGRRFGEFGDALGVAVKERRLEVHEVGESLSGIIKPPLLEPQDRLRLLLEERPPRILTIRPVEQIRAISDKYPCCVGVESFAGAATDDVNRRPDTAHAIEDHGEATRVGSGMASPFSPWGPLPSQRSKIWNKAS
jgi:hypothetical protein